MRHLDFARACSGAAFILGVAAMQPAHAIQISGTGDASVLASQLFLSQNSISVTSSSLSFGTFCQIEEVEGQDGCIDIGANAAAINANGPNQAGTYTNAVGTYGLPSPGVVFSTGDVSNYGTGPNTEAGFSTSNSMIATNEQNTVLSNITGQAAHFDPVELNVTFNVGDISNISFIGVFGSEEFPEFVNDGFNDGFGIFINGTNVASALQTGATPGVDTPDPININHPDMKAVVGTELDGILAPNNIPLMRFDVPVVPNSNGNQLRVILGDAGDGIYDTTVYLSSFGDFTSADGSSEFTPLLPSNQPDIDGNFVFELEAPEIGQVIWIDPPVSVGFTYEVTGNQFASVVAPSLLTVNDPDGYEIVVNGVVVKVLSAGEAYTFATPVTSFILQGIDPALALDPANSVAFPLAVSMATTNSATITMTPITVDTGGSTVIPLPGGMALYLLGLVGFAGFARRKSA